MRKTLINIAIVIGFMIPSLSNSQTPLVQCFMPDTIVSQEKGLCEIQETINLSCAHESIS